jgi:DNA invertase Pin-like site-specific DNA recombinase
MNKPSKIIAYLRVSTAKQGQSGLGLEAQQAAIEGYSRLVGIPVEQTFTEIESGKLNNRPELDKALHHAKVTGATLVIAKLDRLSRNANFLLTLMDSGVSFIAADMQGANNFTIGVMALVAQQEREAIATRTKDALRAAKERGTKLGNPNGAAALRRAAKGNTASLMSIKGKAEQYAKDLGNIIEKLQGEGVTSLGGIAKELRAQGIKTPRGGEWHKTSVKNLLGRLEGLQVD